MPQEAIALRSQSGNQTTGAAEVVRHSPVSRRIRAVFMVLGGLLGGTVCIVIPIVHLFTTWGFPVLGVFMAVRTLKREIVLYGPEGICPNCGEKIQLPGGALNDPDWQVCPQCHARLQVEVAPVIAPHPDIVDHRDVDSNSPFQSTQNSSSRTG